MEETRPTVWEIGERFRGWRLDRFLKEVIPKLSRSQIQKVIRERIGLSWTAKTVPSARLRVGGTVSAGFPRLNEIPAEFRFDVLFEDGEVLAIAKPAGWVVHPTNNCRVNSLIETIRRERKNRDLNLVHRLDRETSGVLVLAESAAVARKWGKAFARRKIRKTYLARVSGSPERSAGIVAAPIGPAEGSRVHVRRTVRPDGQAAVTEFRVLKRFTGSTLLELKPQTGRTHQLRVHCEFSGCPILGDPLYGRPDEHYVAYVAGRVLRARLYLHAWKLEGEVGGKSYALEAPVPVELEEEVSGRAEEAGRTRSS